MSVRSVLTFHAVCDWVHWWVHTDREVRGVGVTTKWVDHVYVPERVRAMVTLVQIGLRHAALLHTPSVLTP